MYENTGGALADLSHAYQFTRGCTILHFNKLQTDSNDNVGRMKSLLSLLPMYLQHSAEENLSSAEKRKTKNNEKTLKNIIGSSMIAMASASNETKADAMARGKTAQKIWFDELAFLFFNKPIMEATIPAFNKASENAAKYGMPYGITITTTPGDLSSPHGAYAYKFMNNCIQFREEMYDLYKNDYKELRKIIKNSKDKNGFLFIQFHYYELGYDDEWYIECTRALDPVRARREYLLEWMNSNGNSPFDEDDITLIMDMAKVKEKKGEIYKITKYFNFVMYSEYKGKLPVVISVDVAATIGRDYNTAVVINPETLEPMGIFRSNNISSENFKKVLIKLVQRYYPYSIITIENNSIGNALISGLKETPLRRLLYRERKKRTIDVGGVGKFTNKVTQEGWEYGHNVNSVSRPLMTSILESMVRYNKSRLAFPELIEEIRFMEVRNGRIQHSSSTHDDVSMAYMGGLYVIKYGKGLKGLGIRYNIAEDADDAVEFEDVEDGMLRANRILKHNARYYEETTKDNALSKMVEQMLDDEPSTTANEFFKKEQKTYLGIKDKIDGIEDYEFNGVTAEIPLSLKTKLIGKISNSRSALNLLERDDDDDDDGGGFLSGKLW